VLFLGLASAGGRRLRVYNQQSPVVESLRSRE